jgi:homoserine O-acetyltransferase/O-succinyltransferase
MRRPVGITSQITRRSALRVAAVSLALCWHGAVGAQQLAPSQPAAKEATWTAPEFRFHNGETLKDVRFHYRTIGEPTGEPVLVIHGTAGSGAGMLGPNFAGQLFGPGQPLDAARYFIIVPDALGAGKSAKPSDGLKAKFPRYNYDDMVDAQYRLVTEHLGIKRLRLVIGNSMGGMHAWVWGVRYPDAMDAIVPMASQPTEMSGRNWMMRRLIIDSIRKDPAYADGNYTAQPASAAFAAVFYALGTNGGNQGLQKLAPTREAADKLLDQRLAAAFPADANDFVYQWDSSRDYNPAPKLESIKAAVLAINSADDERNPPELGIMERELKRINNARLLLIPGSADTVGHGTTASARFWAADLDKFLASVPKAQGAYR